jgi:hypothetical protein
MPEPGTFGAPPSVDDVVDEPTKPTPPATAVSKELTPKALPAATHGRAINAVAVSDDGMAALTIDAGDGVRLWPALDGTREPVAVPLVAPQEVVLARDGADFAIAALDMAGGMVILRVDGTGKLVGKASMPFEHPTEKVIAAGASFLTIRGDQTIERLDFKGASLGQVSPEQGQRISTIVARRGRAIAMLRNTDGVVGRWLDTTKGLAWGAVTPALEIDPTTAVLSPDHLRLAALQKKTRKASIVDIATGVVTPVKGSRTDLVPLNWLDENQVTFAHDEFELSRVEWFDATGKRLASIGDDFELEFLSVLSIDAADNQVVAFQGHQLVLVGPKKLRYLGYQLHAATRLSASPAGMVASLGGSSEILDDALQIERRVPTANTKDLFPIDDTFAIAINGKPTKNGPFDDTIVNPAKRKSGVELVLYEGDTKQQTLKMKVTEMRLRYEPATRLLAVNGGSAITFARFDAATKRFGEPVSLAVAEKIRDIFLLDPAVSGGAIALVVHGGKGGLVVRTVFEDELAGALPREAVALPGELEAVDRAGHVYIRQDSDTITVHASNAEIGKLTSLKQMKIRPAPDGKRVAIFGRGRLILANLDGTQQWSMGFPGIKDLQWTDGEIVALANGIAKLDPANGKQLAARCGWKFGLRNQASFADPPGSTLCDR